jgi:UDP-N-acetylglucosamine transferase subunit ALG13
MIFVSTGTNEQPFDRLVLASAALEVDDPLVVQYGSSAVAPTGSGWCDFLTFDEMTDAMTRARVVVVHAGVGSVLLARRCGKVPVVVPRRVSLGEAVDDHQVPFARRLAAAGLVTLAEDQEQLQAAVDDEARDVSSSIGGDPSGGALARELRDFLDHMVMA